MSAAAPRQVIVAGAGIAGLAAALAFAAHGFSVRVFERAPRLEEVGAGIQLSPNATRLLRRLGVLDFLESVAVRPDAVTLRDGASLKELARIPLGESAETRWGAPYLVVHRADLQNALLARIAQEPAIRLQLDAPVRGVTLREDGAVISVEIERHTEEFSCLLLVGADGVHSAVRGLAGGVQRPSFAGEIAWRATILADSHAGKVLAAAASFREVTAFLRPGFHLIAYPVRAGSAINLAAFTKAAAPTEVVRSPDVSLLKSELSLCSPALRQLGDATDWGFWPVYTVDPRAAWTSARSVALIGDAAHAMTPYAAQGAAMAIEDAATLADAVASAPRSLRPALTAWEAARRPRIARVARRAAFNRFAWHAKGPIAAARNLMLAKRGGERLAADMDWLYDWRSEQ
jgi:salicylate hydroxylase